MLGGFLGSTPSSPVTKYFFVGGRQRLLYALKKTVDNVSWCICHNLTVDVCWCICHNLAIDKVCWCICHNLKADNVCWCVCHNLTVDVCWCICHNLAIDNVCWCICHNLKADNVCWCICHNLKADNVCWCVCHSLKLVLQFQCKLEFYCRVFQSSLDESCLMIFGVGGMVMWSIWFLVIPSGETRHPDLGIKEHI